MLFVSPRKSGIRVGCWPLNLKCFNKQGKCSSAVMIRWQWLEKGIWWQWLKHLKSDNYMQKRLQKTAKQQYIYTAITCVINHKWNSLIRTVPDITLSQSRWKIQWIMFTPAIPSGGCPAVKKKKKTDGAAAGIGCPGHYESTKHQSLSTKTQSDSQNTLAKYFVD